MRHLARLHRGPLTCWSEIFLSKHPKLQHGLQKHPSERHALEKSQSKRPWGSSAAAILRAQRRAAGAGAVQGAARGADADKPVVTVVCDPLLSPLERVRVVVESPGLGN